MRILTWQSNETGWRSEETDSKNANTSKRPCTSVLDRSGSEFESYQRHHAVQLSGDFPVPPQKRRRLARIQRPSSVSACAANRRVAAYSSSVSGHRKSFPQLGARQMGDAFALAGD